MITKFIYCPTPLTKIERVPAHYAPAALALALGAWRLGTDVRQAVQDGGYAVHVAQGLYEYINSPSFVPPLETLSQSQDPDRMSARVKRQRGSTTTTTKARVAPSVKRYVKTCMNRLVETKFKYNTTIGGVPTSSGAVYAVPLYDITEGSGDGNRTGNVINLLRLNFRGSIADGASLPFNAVGYIRAIWVYDKQTNGAAPTVADILESTGVDHPLNHDTCIGYGGGRFKILSDKTHMVSTSDPAVTTYTAVRGSLSLKGLRTRYDTSANTIADIVTGGLFLCLISLSSSTQYVVVTDVRYQDA